MNKLIYQYALKQLSRREYSSKKLNDLLLRKDFQQTDIDEVIEKLTKQNFLSDQRYGEIKARYLFKKGYSINTIRRMLKQEGIDSDLTTIENSLEGLDNIHDERVQAIIEKIKKRHASKDSYYIKNKIFQKLYSLGLKIDNHSLD